MLVRKFGLIGYPLSHSFSKKYFTEKFQRENIADCAYELYPLEQIDAFPALLHAVEELEGLNVTIPYKTDIIPFLDRVDEAALQIGAVNCIRFIGKETVGYNTDAMGFEHSLKPLLKTWHTQALVLGTGGAAKAVAYVLEKLGIRFHGVSRHPHSANGYRYDQLDETLMQQHTLIINTTPLGMSPNPDTAPLLPYEFLGKQHLLYDLVYNPAETLFLTKGKAQGATVKNGHEMLLLQAEASWDIWNAPASGV